MKIVSANITGSFILNGVDLTTTVESSSIWSGSIASRVSSLEQFSSSLDSTYATDVQLNAVTQSVNTLSSSFLSYTSSTDDKIAQLNRETSSLNLATASLYAATASLYNTTASLFNYTSSNTMNIVNLFATSASLNAAVADIRNTTASLYNATASIYGATSSLFAYTASSTLRINALDQYTASLNTRSASFACITATNNFACAQYFSNTSNAISFTSTGSLYSDGGMRITKDMYVSGTAYFNNVTVFGTQSINYITSSQLNIASNLITVNTSTPAVRFGGLAVYDSGSLGTGLTGSILWDSEANHWVYSNPSGSSYSGGMFISGPRSAALGSEQGTTACALMMGQGGDHITSSAIFHYGNATCFYGNSRIDSSGNACFNNQICGYSLSSTCLNTSVALVGGCVGIGGINPSNPLHIYTDVNGPSTAIKIHNGSACAGATTGIEFELLSDYCDYKKAEIRAVAASQYANNIDLAFWSGGSTTDRHAERMRIFSTGETCFACQVCAPVAIFTDCVGIGTTSPSRTLHVRTDTGVLIRGATSDVDALLSFLPTSGGRQYDFRNYGSSFGIKDASADIIRMYFHFNGNTGIGTGTTTPSAKLTIDDASTITNTQIDLIGNSSTPKGHIGQFSHALYLSSNWYYNGSQNNDCNTFGQANIVLAAGTTNTSTISFALSDAGCTSPITRMIMNSTGITCFSNTICAKSIWFSSNSTGQITFGSNDACNPYVVSDTNNALYLGNNNSYKIFVPNDGTDMIFRTAATYGNPQTRLTITAAGIACFACQVCMPATAVISGGGNTLVLRKGTGSPAVAFAGNSDEAAFLIEGISGGGLKWYTSPAGCTLSNAAWNAKFNMDVNGISTFSCTVCAVSFRTGDNSYYGKGAARLRSSNNNKYLDLQATDTCAIIASNFGDSDVPLILGSWGGYQNNQLFLSTNCNVGIWTNNPAYRLDVSGPARVGTLLVSNATTTTWCVGRIDNAKTNCWYQIFGWGGIYDGAYALVQLGYEDNNGDGANAHSFYMTAGPAYSTGFGVEQIGGATNLCLRRNGQTLEALITGVDCRSSGAYIGFTVQSMNVAS